MTDLVTYEDPDGELIDIYTFVTGLEWFEDEDEPRRLRRRTWVLVEDVEGTHYPSTPMLCPFCEDDDSCSVCGGTGEHPNRGDGFVPDEPDQRRAELIRVLMRVHRARQLGLLGATARRQKGES